MPSKTEIEIDGAKLQLSNLDKVFYPDTGFTKGQVIDYYIRIAPVLLPHLADRPLTLKRYPNGAAASFFYQKECPLPRPDWVPTAPVWSERNRKNVHFCVVNDLPSLIWAVNLGTLELHTSLSLAENVLQPTTLVFDLDPGPPATIIDCCQVALWLREIFEAHQLVSLPKTSGSKGLQIYVPLNTPTSYDQTKPYAHALAKLLEKEHPDQVVSKMRKDLRAGKVFVDWSQNDDHKTTVCVYSLRAKDHPSVSTPVTWQEVETAWQTKKSNTLDFDCHQVLERVARQQDLFAPLVSLQQTLPAQI